MPNNDLISRAAAIEIAEKYGCNNGSVLGHHSGIADCIASEIAKLHAVDAAPVVHGRWIKETDRENHWHCSECGVVVGIVAEYSPYCYKCGAKMDE